MQLICKKKELFIIVTLIFPQKYFAKSDKNIPLHQK